ncbi:galactose-specific lectin nattectin-like [Neocloeon triangulifer]|uniref:galactose-specific lectin nattectin-like n=1 Tax=Neocloeon triangulifer TaxID=2078957 RepID=UPI00286ED082|nr:galactose-specific lectin nattectin-like [Neocloeon triangulifer]
MKTKGATLIILCICIAGFLPGNGKADSAIGAVVELMISNCVKVYDRLNIGVTETGTYLFTTQYLTWDEARQYCKGLGLELATTDTKLKTDVIFEEALDKFKNETARFWTSGSDKGRKPGKFFWSNGNALNESLWLSGQPKNVNDKEPSCITLRKGGLGDCPCSVRRRTVCEYIE